MKVGLFEKSVLFKVEYMRLFFSREIENNKQETNVRAIRDGNKWKRKLLVPPKATPVIRTVHAWKN